MIGRAADPPCDKHRYEKFPGPKTIANSCNRTVCERRRWSDWKRRRRRNRGTGGPRRRALHWNSSKRESNWARCVHWEHGKSKRGPVEWPVSTDWNSGYYRDYCSFLKLTFHPDR